MPPTRAIRPARLVPAACALAAFAATFVLAAACKKGEAAASGAPSAETKARVAPTCATCVVADDQGFNPSRLVVPAGKPGETRSITFTRVTDETCATEVVFPSLNIRQKLPLNQPVAIAIPADGAKTYAFQCGMGMYKSSLVVN